MYTWLKRRWRRARAEGDRGSALVLVIGIAAVLTIVVSTGLTLAQSATLKSGADRDAASAVAAAYAGIADYSARLTNDNSYINKGDPHAPFSAHSTGLTLPTSLNAAFCYGQSGNGCTPDTWAPVPGATGNEAFRYEVDNSQYNSQGTVQLLATGRSGNTTRSIRASVRQSGYLQYVYFSNYETMDPALLPTPSNGHNLKQECANYQWGTGTDYASGAAARPITECGGYIQFSSSESITGPIRSNDTMLICGGTFTGKIITGDPNSPYYLTGSGNGCSGNVPASSFRDGTPQHEQTQPLPPDNLSLVAETSTADPNPGCLYTGPTAITFNSDGTMTVISPWTKSTYSDAMQSPTIPVATRNAECGTPGSTGLGAPRSASNPNGGQTIPVIPQNLIYVQAVPTVTGNPNTWGATYPAFGNSCHASLTGTNDLGYPFTTGNNATTPNNATTYSKSTFPVGSAPASSASSETVTSFGGNNYYDCLQGDAFIYGTVKGQVTVAASHYVYLTGNLKYATSNDILGIDGQSAIWVWNPAYGCSSLTGGNDTQSATSTGCSAQLTQSGRTINAAMMSVNDTFQVQNYNLVGDGAEPLKVTGAIVQNFRGTVGLVNSKGFTKQYTYDTRLQYISPPRFQNAVAAPWSAIQYSAAQPAFSADGTAR